MVRPSAAAIFSGSTKRSPSWISPSWLSAFLRATAEIQPPYGRERLRGEAPAEAKAHRVVHAMPHRAVGGGCHSAATDRDRVSKYTCTSVLPDRAWINSTCTGARALMPNKRITGGRSVGSTPPDRNRSTADRTCNPNGWCGNDADNCRASSSCQSSVGSVLLENQACRTSGRYRA